MKKGSGADLDPQISDDRDGCALTEKSETDDRQHPTLALHGCIALHCKTQRFASKAVFFCRSSFFF